MSDLALRAHSLSKLYHIGARIDPHVTLCDWLPGVVALPALSQGQSTARNWLDSWIRCRDGGQWKAV